MWFSLFAVVLILAITFFQGLHGLFSAVIMCILTIVSAALAFGLYEDAYATWLIERQPDHGRAIALIAIFLVALLILRTAFDKLITSNLQFPLYVDRIGGGAFGLVTATVVVGMLALGMQMMPFGRTLLGFARFSVIDTAKGSAVPAEANLATLDWSTLRCDRNKVWLNPDGLVVNLVSHVSGNALAGRNRFSDVYPDFLGNLGRGSVTMAPGIRTTVGPGALRIEECWDLRPDEFLARKRESQEGKDLIRLVRSQADLKPGHKRLAVRVSLDSSATDGDGYRFAAEQVRLLARARKDAPTTEYFPIGISDAHHRDRIVEVHPGEVFHRKGNDAGKLVFAFEVPQQPEFEPLYLVYKNNARAELPRTSSEKKKKPAARPGTGRPNPETAEPPPTPEPNPPPEPTGNSDTPPEPPRPPRDRVRVFRVADKDPFFSDRLPFTLTQYSKGTDFESSGSTIRGTKNLVATLDEDDQPMPGSQPPLESFDVPADLRLLHVNVEKLQPGSLLGRVLNMARTNVKSIYLLDDQNRQHRVVGAYALARVSGTPTFELIYLTEMERDFARLPDLARIRDRNLTGECAYVLLFQVPPGTRPKRLFTSSQTSESLERFNLVAPD